MFFSKCVRICIQSLIATCMWSLFSTRTIHLYIPSFSHPSFPLHPLFFNALSNFFSILMHYYISFALSFPLLLLFFLFSFSSFLPTHDHLSLSLSLLPSCPLCTAPSVVNCSCGAQRGDDSVWIPRATCFVYVWVRACVQRSVMSLWLLSTEDCKEEYIFPFNIRRLVTTLCLSCSQSHIKFRFIKAPWCLWHEFHM